jgi:hypothetical protein
MVSRCLGRGQNPKQDLCGRLRAGVNLLKIMRNNNARVGKPIKICLAESAKHYYLATLKEDFDTKRLKNLVE